MSHPRCGRRVSSRGVIDSHSSSFLPADRESPVDYTLFNEIPVDLMVRHQFLPLKRDAKGLHIAMADPADLDRPG